MSCIHGKHNWSDDLCAACGDWGAGPESVRILKERLNHLARTHGALLAAAKSAQELFEADGARAPDHVEVGGAYAIERALRAAIADAEKQP